MKIFLAQIRQMLRGNIMILRNNQPMLKMPFPSLQIPEQPHFLKNSVAPFGPWFGDGTVILAILSRLTLNLHNSPAKPAC
jgi:hypothetical protein